MKAAVACEVGMPSEERIAKIESHVSHVLSTVVELKNDGKELRGEFHSFKADTAKEFGLVRAELEKLRTAIESTKVWFLVTCFGAVFSGIGALVGLRALKLF